MLRGGVKPERKGFTDSFLRERLLKLCSLHYETLNFVAIPPIRLRDGEWMGHGSSS